MPSQPFERLSYDPEYNQALAYLYGLQKFGIKFGLSKTENLLKAFGDPQRKLRLIHVAGSNGKGSVSAMLASVYSRMGYMTGLFTSPHLVDFRERFQINGRMISQEQTLDLIQEIQEKTDPGEPPTFFEFVTAMALIYFHRQEVDLGIMEVGLGGRLDATNTIFPLMTIITTITLEHQEFLGKTLKKIALEKAGIIKNRVPLVSGVTQKGIQVLYQKICREKNVPFFLAGRDFKTRKRGQGKFDYFGRGGLVGEKGKSFSFLGKGAFNAERRTPNALGMKKQMELKELHLGLLGNHQIKNACLALTAVHLLQAEGFPVTEEKIREGLRKVFWPARMEILSQRPFVILDGAHNKGAMKVLAEGLRENFLYQRFFLIIGIMKDKDIRGVMSQIAPLADFVFLTRAEYERSAEPEVLKTHLTGIQVPCRLFPGIPQAMDQALQEAGEGDLICITGSLFVAGEARAYWGQGLKKTFFTEDPPDRV